MTRGPVFQIREEIENKRFVFPTSASGQRQVEVDQTIDGRRFDNSILHQRE